MEIVFKSLAVLALAGLALWLTSIPFGILAFATLFLTREEYYQNKITCRLREILKGHVILENQKIPEAHLKSILPELSIGLTAKSVTAKALANRADSVWRRLSQHAPKFWPSFALLAVYVGTFIFGIGGTFVLAVATNALNQKALIVQRMTSDGKTVQVEERYWKQVKIFEAQLNEQGLYDGPSTTWTRKGVKRQEGFWAKGYWQGEWKNYDSKGNIESIVTYDNGRPHKYQIARSGAFVEVTPEQWPMAIKYSIQASPTGTHVKTQAR